MTVTSRPHRSVLTVAAAAAALALTATGCSGGGGSPAPGPTGATKTGTPTSPSLSKGKAYDPPSDFSSPDTPSMPDDAILGKVTMGDWLAAPPAVALVGPVAYVGGTKAIEAVDPASGAVIGTAAPVNPAIQPPQGQFSATQNSAPVEATSGGKDVVLAAFATTVAGHGTTANTTVAEVVAMDTSTHAAAWTAQLSLPGWASGDSADSTVATVLAARGSWAVVSVTSGSEHTFTAVVDLTAHRGVWQQDGVSAQQVSDSQLVAVEPADDPNSGDSKVVGLRLADGGTVWQKPQYTSVRGAAAVGAHFVLMNVYDSTRQHDVGVLLDAVSGNEVQSSTSSDSPLVDVPQQCLDDGRSVVVCAAGSAGGTPDSVVAYDATTGKVLWQLPDSANNRVAPRVTAVWHGRVYGMVDDRPVMLDATTGADVQGTPRIAPVVVDGYYGLALDSDNTHLVAYHTSA